jgi:hypothetical protein
MSASPASTKDRDEVEPCFVVKVAALTLAALAVPRSRTTKCSNGAASQP